VPTNFDTREAFDLSAVREPNLPTGSTASPAGGNSKIHAKSTLLASRVGISNASRYRSRKAKRARRRLRAARKILLRTVTESRPKLLY
jgi:hypothetical protein